MSENSRNPFVRWFLECGYLCATVVLLVALVFLLKGWISGPIGPHVGEPVPIENHSPVEQRAVGK